ncbi:helix-turn-helix domain-containing protein [Ferrovibrio xuzhouensis]|uniref:Helix-turn-helix domain-containing protein n=1 Tax=Ferrovibrio xuzhouensis TaxID=1576914 RepID=A0ABV7VBB5_9PROT
MQNHLKAWRDSRDWTMAEMGERLGGATASQVSKLEKSRQKLNDDWLQRYARAFGVKPADILGPPDAKSAAAPAVTAMDEDAFMATIRAGLLLSGVRLSRAEEMKLVGHALEIWERIRAGADPAALLADLVKADDTAGTRTPARR